jgi:hypothetical protein
MNPDGKVKVPLEFWLELCEVLQVMPDITPTTFDNLLIKAKFYRGQSSDGYRQFNHAVRLLNDVQPLINTAWLTLHQYERGEGASKAINNANVHRAQTRLDKVKEKIEQFLTHGS